MNTSVIENYLTNMLGAPRNKSEDIYKDERKKLSYTAKSINLIQQIASDYHYKPVLHALGISDQTIATQKYKSCYRVAIATLQTMPWPCYFVYNPDDYGLFSYRDWCVPEFVKQNYSLVLSGSSSGMWAPNLYAGKFRGEMCFLFFSSDMFITDSTTTTTETDKLAEAWEKKSGIKFFTEVWRHPTGFDSGKLINALLASDYWDETTAMQDIKETLSSIQRNITKSVQLLNHIVPTAEEQEDIGEI